MCAACVRFIRVRYVRFEQKRANSGSTSRKSNFTACVTSQLLINCIDWIVNIIRAHSITSYNTDMLANTQFTECFVLKFSLKHVHVHTRKLIHLVFFQIIDRNQGISLYFLKVTKQNKNWIKIQFNKK